MIKFTKFNTINYKHKHHYTKWITMNYYNEIERDTVEYIENKTGA